MHELKLMDVQKKYKDKEAVRKFNYTFTNGVYGLLGDGAGRNNINRIDLWCFAANGEIIYCDDIEIDSMGAEYVGYSAIFPQDLDIMAIFIAERLPAIYRGIESTTGRLCRSSYIDELLDMVELKNVKKKKLKTFSGGIIRRIGIAQALLNNPEILILDKPTAGLDRRKSTLW